MEQKARNTTLTDSTSSKKETSLVGKKSFQLNTLALPFNLTQGQQKMAARGPFQTAACFGASEEISMGFSVLSGSEKVKTRATICNV